MEQAQPTDEALIESLKSLIISRKRPVTVAQLKQDYELLEGRKIPEMKLELLLKFNKTFHFVKPREVGGKEMYDVRFDARTVAANSVVSRQKPPQKVRFNPTVMTRPLRNLAVPRNRIIPMNPNNNNNNHMMMNNNNVQKNGNNGYQQTVIQMKPLPKLTMPLSERLKRNGELSPEDIKAANNLFMPDSWYLVAGSNYDKLFKYCQSKAIDAPELSFFNNPFAKNSFACQVTVNGKTYSSYNEFFSTKEQAQEAACKVSVQELKREEELSRNPFDASNDFDIAQKIWLMIRNSPGGAFFSKITDLYMDAYKLSLPENWNQVVKKFEGQLFEFETLAFKDEIIFAIGDGTIERPLTPVDPAQNIPELEFPWKDKFWNVYVTSAFNPSDMCARLIGKDYSDSLDRLLNEIEMSMMTSKERPIDIKINHVYLTSISECWHRIKIIDFNDREVNCICIDNGDYEWILRDEIYVCKPAFLTVAPQAFKLALFGLEEFENNPSVAQEALYEPFVYKSLVAEVLMNKEFFEMNKTKPIKTILYDTTTEEDVNLNQKLMNMILSSISAPTLNQKESNQIIVTHIGDDAIYGQLVKSFSYIQQLINNVSKDDLPSHRGLYEDRSTQQGRKKFYLVFDAQLKNWFRARFEKSLDANIHIMFMIDHGYAGKFNTHDIYRLDKLSYVLSFYPPQAIKFNLFNVSYNEDVKKRLLGLLPPGRRQAFAKVVNVTSGNVPNVALFMYILHNSESIIFNINDQFSKVLSVSEITGERPNEPLIKLERRQLKNNGEFINLFVSLVSSPLSFVIQLDEDLKQLKGIVDDLQKHCNTTAKFSTLSDLQKGECYAVYDDDSHMWVRASVENILDKDFIHCLFVDSGNFKTMSLDKMRTLPNKFRTLPKLALKARLNGVKPKFKDFTPDDAIHFKKLTENKSFPAVIKQIIACDPFEKQDIYDVVLFGHFDVQ